MKLDNTVALVTGAGSGIGRAIATEFANEGARVVVNDIDEAAAEGTVSLVRDSGGEAFAAVCDISRLEAHDWLLERTVSTFETVNVLVNCAGIQERRPFLDMTADVWDRILGVNLRGPFFLAQSAARIMIRNGGGRIINLASVQDDWPLRQNSIYGISKGGMRMLTKCLALELAPFGVTVNAISPGAIATPMNQVLLDDAEARSEVESRIPLARLGAPKEIARAAVYFASSDSEYTTGSTLYVDGGLLLD